MKRAGILFVVLALGLSGCGFGQSRLNPFNWFRSAPKTEALAPVNVQNADRRPVVAEIVSVSVDRTPGGAIIRALALPPAQGWYGAGLVSEDPGGVPVRGVLRFSFRAWPPDGPTLVSTPQSRELSAAVFLSDIKLAGVREIRVTGAVNARAARR